MKTCAVSLKHCKYVSKHLHLLASEGSYDTQTAAWQHRICYCIS